VLQRRIGSVGAIGNGAKREMVEQVSDTEILAGLRNKLGSLHIGVPSGVRVNSHHQTVRLRCIGRVLVARGKSEIIGRRLGPMNVPLIVSHFIRPRPLVEDADAGVGVKTSTPDCCASVG